MNGLVAGDRNRRALGDGDSSRRHGLEALVGCNAPNRCITLEGCEWLSRWVQDSISKGLESLREIVHGIQEVVGSIPTGSTGTQEGPRSVAEALRVSGVGLRVVGSDPKPASPNEYRHHRDANAGQRERHA